MRVLTITVENFEQEVLNSKIPVLLEIWAPWCVSCRMMAPILEEIACDFKNIKVGKINIDDQPELIDAFEVISIPTFIVIKNGEIAISSIGAKSKTDILDMIIL